MLQFSRQPDRTRQLAPRHAPREYRSRGAQFQLLALIFALMFVLVMMQEAAKPKNWAWMWGISSSDVAQSETATRLLDDSSASIDTRIPNDNGGSAGGDEAIVAAAELPPRDGTSLANVAGYLPGVDPERFYVIRDDTIFRREELPVWYEMFEALADRSDAELKKYAPTEIGFVQLYQQPNLYRGKLVTFRGTIHRAQHVDDQGERPAIPGYWQCWVRPTGTNQVIVVYALHMPEGFPQGEQIEEPAEFVGLYFKRWAYMAQDGMRSAPLVLVRQPTWTPQPATLPHNRPSLTPLLGGLLAFGLLGSVLVWRLSRRPANRLNMTGEMRREPIDVELLRQRDQGVPPIGPSEGGESLVNGHPPGSGED